MASVLELHGRAALLSGSCAFLITAAFVYVNDGLAVGASMGRMLESMELLTGYVALALLFQWGTPAACALSLFFGISSRKLWTARIGMAASSVSLIAYMICLRGCHELITAA